MDIVDREAFHDPAAARRCAWGAALLEELRRDGVVALQRLGHVPGVRCVGRGCADRKEIRRSALVDSVLHPIQADWGREISKVKGYLARRRRIEVDEDPIGLRRWWDGVRVAGVCDIYRDTGIRLADHPGAVGVEELLAVREAVAVRVLARQVGGPGLRGGCIQKGELHGVAVYRRGGHRRTPVREDMAGVVAGPGVLLVA